MRFLLERERTEPSFGLQTLGLRQLKRDLRAAHRPPRWSRARLVAGAGAALLLALIALGAGILRRPTPDHLDDVLAAVGDRQATAPGIPVLDLGPAGFRPIAVRPGASTLLVYEGPHGCRVGLAVDAPGRTTAGRPGAGTASWAARGRTFILVARGMDPDRFEHLAAAVEILSRGTDPERAQVALRAAGEGRACVG